MDDFPEGSVKEEDSMMDVMEAEELDTTGEDYNDFRAQLSARVSAPDQCKMCSVLFICQYTKGDMERGTDIFTPNSPFYSCMLSYQAFEQE